MLPGLHLDIISALVDARGRLGRECLTHFILTITCETSTA